MKLNSLTHRFAKMTYEKTEIKPVHFMGVSRSISPCLVLMPGKLEEIKPAAEILPEIAASLPNRTHKIIISSSIDPQSYMLIRNFIVIRTEPYDYDTFSLPKKPFIDKISYGGVSIVIDLDLKPNMFNAVLSLRSGGKVRTTFDKGVGLPYYNMIVDQGSSESNPRAIYRIMADVIGNFRF
jgi:hypothetical protein